MQHHPIYKIINTSCTDSGSLDMFSTITGIGTRSRILNIIYSQIP